jgi:hypothetical protein
LNHHQCINIKIYSYFFIYYLYLFKMIIIVNITIVKLSLPKYKLGFDFVTSLDLKLKTPSVGLLCVKLIVFRFRDKLIHVSRMRGGLRMMFPRSYRFACSEATSLNYLLGIISISAVWFSYYEFSMLNNFLSINL